MEDHIIKEPVGTEYVTLKQIEKGDLTPEQIQELVAAVKNMEVTQAPPRPPYEVPGGIVSDPAYHQDDLLATEAARVLALPRPPSAVMKPNPDVLRFLTGTVVKE